MDCSKEPKRPAPPALVGGRRDEHGCIPSAGYTFCGTIGRCHRPFEEECPDCDTCLARQKGGENLACHGCAHDGDKADEDLCPAPATISALSADSAKVQCERAQCVFAVDASVPLKEQRSCKARNTGVCYGNDSRCGHNAVGNIVFDGRRWKSGHEMTKEACLSCHDGCDCEWVPSGEVSEHAPKAGCPSTAALERLPAATAKTACEAAGCCYWVDKHDAQSRCEVKE